MSKLKEVFDIFCGTDPNRPVMLAPFVVEDKTYATDAYGLVRCDNDKIDFDFVNNHKPLDVKAAMPKIHTSEIINIDLDWHSLMTEDETIGDGNNVECGKCKGEGTCDDTVYYKNKRYVVEYECPVCDGSGLEQEEKFTKTGNKTFKGTDLVKLKDAYFYAKNFYRLKKVKDILGAEVELISCNDTKRGFMFKVGVVEVLIMPMNAIADEFVIIKL